MPSDPQVLAWLPFLLLLAVAAFLFLAITVVMPRLGRGRAPRAGETPAAFNRAYLSRLWLVVALVWIPFLMFYIGAVVSGRRRHLVPVVFTLTMMVILGVRARGQAKKAMAGLLAADNAEAHRRHFEKQFARARSPHLERHLASIAAIAHACYGQLDGARRALDAVDWSDVPPLMSAQRLLAEAMIAYVGGDAVAGLERIEESQRLAAGSRPFPGSASGDLTLRTYRNLGLVLSARETEATLQELREARTRLTYIPLIAAAWGLALASKRRGDEVEAAESRRFIADRAPHFAPVLRSIDQG